MSDRAEHAIADEVAATLQSYIYLYTDPRDNQVFYIGKGRGSRLFAHLDEPSGGAKA
jgi:hypothetical protein